MKAAWTAPPRRPGFSLIETAISLGVLVAAMPMAFLAIGEAGKSAVASEAENRGCRIVPLCVEEIRASREGRSRWFSTTAIDGNLPPDGEFWALALSADGTVVGVLDKQMHETGAFRLDNKPIRYIATMTSAPRGSGLHPAMRNVCITLEYPAAAPVGRRGKSEFHTLIP